MYERHPEGRPEETRGHEKLTRVSELKEWEVENDIRGWSLFNRDNDEVGKVDDMIADTNTGEVTHLIVAYDQVLGIGGKKTVIPMGHVDLYGEDKRVVFHGTSDDLHNAPEYEEDMRDYASFTEYWNSRMVGKRTTTEHETGRITGARVYRRETRPEWEGEQVIEPEPLTEEEEEMIEEEPRR